METGSTAKPGWYPNPSDGTKLHYWDGYSWTSRTADIRESGFWKRHRILRRVLWTIYTVLLAAMLLGNFFMYWDWGVARTYVSALVYMTAAVALVLHTWDIRTLSTSFWKAVAFGFIGYLTGIFLSAPIEGEGVLWGMVTVLIPLYIALFRYAYRTWPE